MLINNNWPPRREIKVIDAQVRRSNGAIIVVQVDVVINNHITPTDGVREDTLAYLHPNTYAINSEILTTRKKQQDVLPGAKTKSCDPRTSVPGAGVMSRVRLFPSSS